MPKYKATIHLTSFITKLVEAENENRAWAEANDKYDTEDFSIDELLKNVDQARDIDGDTDITITPLTQEEVEG